MENKLTPELIEKAKSAKSPEELIALAKENGIELSAEQARDCFAKLNPKNGELGDDELDNVSGGGCVSDAVDEAEDAVRKAKDAAKKAVFGDPDKKRQDYFGIDYDGLMESLKKGGVIGTETTTGGNSLTKSTLAPITTKDDILS
jgi:predicted ribosomally synthesized peptide with nif11-like leader